MTQITSFNPSLYVLAPTSVGGSIENVSVLRASVARVLDAGQVRPLAHRRRLALLTSPLAVTAVAVSPQEACRWSAPPRLRILRAGESSVGHEGRMGSYTSGKEGNAMGRTEAVSDQATWVIAQTAQRVRERLAADGVFCDADANAFAGFQDAPRLTLTHAHGDRMTETIKRTGVLTEHVIRKDREFKRDMDRIVTELLTRPDNVTDMRQAA